MVREDFLRSPTKYCDADNARTMLLVTIPGRLHPIPFRTRKLSSLGPMVLQAIVCGRVGRCQILIEASWKHGASFFLTDGGC